MLYAEFPVQCDAVFVSLVVENPLTGTKCIIDVKVDTGSPYTIKYFANRQAICEIFVLNPDRLFDTTCMGGCGR